MSAQVSITLSEALSRRVRQLAQQHQEEVVVLVERVLDEALPTPVNQAMRFDLSEPDEHANAEMQAYIAMHPSLKATHYGKHVAIFNGKLVDADDDFDVLFDRVNAAYPHQFVWISKVGDEPIETFTVRSPRFTPMTPHQ
ncbi:MAG: hypothetical protein R2867_32815 [Caldilineaceae bacterium]